MGNSKIVGLIKDRPVKPVKPTKPANNGHYHNESRTADWVAAVAMIVEKNQAKVKESKKPLSENASAKDIDVVRARTLSSQI